MKETDTISISAPGRVCLFGDHQDYLELPVIACAINRTVQLKAQPNKDQVFRLELPDIQKERTIAISETFENLEAGDFFASGLRATRKHGCIPTQGYDIHITSDVPINAGLSSSSALTVAWVGFLLQSFGCDHQIDQELIGQIAYEAEVLEHHSPGGKMDQYTSAMGGTLFIKTKDPFGCIRLPDTLTGLVVGASGVPKSTVGTLGHQRERAWKAIHQVQEHHPHFDIAKATPDDIEKYKPLVETELQPYFYAAIQNHWITQQALLELEKPQLNMSRIGDLMNQHHTILKNSLGLTVDLIDQMIDAALTAGAYGAKIVGSGGGGCIVALAPQGKESEVSEAIKSVGAQDAFLANIRPGIQFK